MGQNEKTNSEPIQIKCEGADTLPIEAITEFQGGLKSRTKKDLALILRSIQRYGFSFPFFIWKDGTVNQCLDGHGRLQALRELASSGAQTPEFPVVYVEAADSDEAKQKLLRLNSQYGAMTKNSVLEFIGGMKVDFTELQLSSGRIAFVDRNTRDDDELPVVTNPRTKPGDLVELSCGGTTHRLLCGSAVVADDVRKVMGGGMADLLLTDPPYNIDYEGKTKESLKIKNDSMAGADFHRFLVDAFTAARDSLKPGGVFYIWHADSEGLNFRSACNASDLQVRQCLIWNKNSIVIGRQDYHWKHEPCLYGWKAGAAHDWFADRKQSTIIDCDRPSRSTEHPTMKPVDLFAGLIVNSTADHQTVLDPFLGSGTTLIACEKLGRICCGLEIDPVYCDVIIARYIAWCESNNLKAQIKTNGTPTDYAR